MMHHTVEVHKPDHEVDENLEPRVYYALDLA